MHTIGIRYEDKYKMERRVPLVPEHIRKLIQAGLSFEIEKSTKRVFKDNEFAEAGAKLVDKIEKADIILGVKEIPLNYFEKNKTYIFFSHVIKGQPYNMPMLRQMIAKQVNLIDYEKIADEQDRRLIFFGRFAGMAGIINSLWALGKRWELAGYKTPFLHLQQTYHYDSLIEAKSVVSKIGKEISSVGCNSALSPVVVGITGYGNASNGVQDILKLLPIVQISPAELLNLKHHKDYSKNVIFQVVFEEKHLFKPTEEGKEFDLNEYYQFPERFESQFEQYLPYITVLMNCIYWNDRCPRIVTKDYLEKLFNGGTPKLAVIGDVTCDPNGSVECTHKGTAIEDPVFVYNPFTRIPAMGFEGEGILVMAVDILPSELPRDASGAFSDALINFIPEIAKADFNQPFQNLTLALPIKNALILQNGKFTPDYQYLDQYI